MAATGQHVFGFQPGPRTGTGGAAGRVFAASELALSDRLVALKVTVEGCREAEILGRLQHENIVPVYSVQEDEDADLTAFCMPYRGQATLAAVLDCLYAGARSAPPGSGFSMRSRPPTRRKNFRIRRRRTRSFSTPDSSMAWST